MKGAFRIRASEAQTRMLVLYGRNAWALAELIKAGEKGCTPITHPGPRWSAYVHRLRHEHGLDIETIHEVHGGAFPGNHARYVLRSAVEAVSMDSVAA